MSMDGVILIKGDHISKIGYILSAFGYTLPLPDYVVKFRDMEISRCANLGVFLYKGWTVIFDQYCGILQTEKNYKKWKEWSSTLNTEIFIMEQYSVISRAAYCIYDKGQVRRAYCSVDGDILVNAGSPPQIEVQLTEKARSYLFIDEEIDEDLGVLGEFDLFKIMKEITGIDYHGDKHFNSLTDAIAQYFH